MNYTVGSEGSPTNNKNTMEILKVPCLKVPYQELEHRLLFGGLIPYSTMSIFCFLLNFTHVYFFFLFDIPHWISIPVHFSIMVLMVGDGILFLISKRIISTSPLKVNVWCKFSVDILYQIRKTNLL